MAVAAVTGRRRPRWPPEVPYGSLATSRHPVLPRHVDGPGLGRAWEAMLEQQAGEAMLYMRLVRVDTHSYVRLGMDQLGASTCKVVSYSAVQVAAGLELQVRTYGTCMRRGLDLRVRVRLAGRH